VHSIDNGPQESDRILDSWSEEARPIALAQLTRILGSAHFRSTKRCSHFLKYVVEHASAAHPERLKERTLGVEVFERDPHYDTNQDPVVRTTAGEVRKRLAQYYLEPGHEDEIRISLPPGSYLPEIHPPPVKLEAVVHSPPAEPEAVGRRPTVFPRRSLFILGPVVILLVVAVVVSSLHSEQTDLDRFWAPVINQQESVLICLGQPKAYSFNKLQPELNAWVDNGSNGQNPPAALATLPLSDIVPAWDRFVTLADAQVFSQLTSMLAKKGKTAQIRGSRSVSLSDLRGKNCVLVGAFNNDWTLGLTGELRYYFESVTENGAEVSIVRDRQTSDKSDWRVVNAWPYWKIPVDYALVSRIHNPTTEQSVVSVAGITHYGTLAAGEFLTNEAYFAEALKHAPNDWYRKNMQIVLSTRVMSGKNGPPQVLAVHFW
jgi:hypothetical protein